MPRANPEDLNKAPNKIEFDKECRRLLEDIHMFDVLRSDRSISSNGLEPRTPFLDKSFTQYYLSLPQDIRYLGGKNKFFEKYKNILSIADILVISPKKIKSINCPSKLNAEAIDEFLVIFSSHIPEWNGSKVAKSYE